MELFKHGITQIDYLKSSLVTAYLESNLEICFRYYCGCQRYVE